MKRIICLLICLCTVIPMMSLHAQDTPSRTPIQIELDVSFLYRLIPISNGRFVALSDSLTPFLITPDGANITALTGHTDWVFDLIQLADGRLLTLSADGTTRLWDTDGQPLAVWDTEATPVRSASQLADGTIFAWGMQHALLWDTSGAVIWQMVFPEEDIAHAFLLPTGRILISSFINHLSLWETDGTLVAQLESYAEPSEIIILPDGRFVTWLLDGTAPVYVWSADGEAQFQLAHPSGRIWGALALADGRLLTWDTDGAMLLWDLTDGTLVSTISRHRDAVIRAIQLPNGRILSWSYDETVRLRDLETGFFAVLIGHVESIDSAIPLADDRILTWVYNKPMYVWDANGNPLWILVGSDATGSNVAQLAGGQIVAYAWNSSRIYIWELD